MAVKYNLEFVLFFLALILSSILKLKIVYSMKSGFFFSITLNQLMDVCYEEMKRIVIFI